MALNNGPDIWILWELHVGLLLDVSLESVLNLGYENVHLSCTRYESNFHCAKLHLQNWHKFTAYSCFETWIVSVFISNLLFMCRQFGFR
jgi:hypothetical protein